jgi:ribosomal protein L40E
MAEARFQLPRTHLDYGLICPDCAGPKTVQASRCRRCWFELRRDRVGYWASRTCRCGAAKSIKGGTCRGCLNERLRAGLGGFKAQPQPQSHPWRRKRLVAA